MREQNQNSAPDQSRQHYISPGISPLSTGEFHRILEDILNKERSEEKNQAIIHTLKKFLDEESYRLLCFLSILNPHAEGNIDRECIEATYPSAETCSNLIRLIDLGLVQYSNDNYLLFITSSPIREALANTSQDLHAIAVKYYKVNSRYTPNDHLLLELLYHRILAGQNANGYDDFIALSSSGETEQNFLLRMIETGNILCINLDLCQRGIILQIIGRYLYQLNRFADSLDYYQKSIDIFTHLHNTSKLADALTSYGNVLRFMGKYTEAEKSLKKSIELCNILDQEKNLPEIAKTYQIFGFLCYQIDNNVESEYNLVLAYSHYNELFSQDSKTYWIPLGKTLDHLIKLYQSINQADWIEYYYKKFLEIVDEFSPDTYTDAMNQVYADVIHHYAEYLFNSGKMKNAEELFLKAFQYRRTLAVKNPELSSSEYSNSLFFLTWFYQVNNNPEKATEYYHEAISILRKICELHPLLFTQDYIRLQIMAKTYGVAVSEEENAIILKDIARFIEAVQNQRDESFDISGFELGEIVSEFGQLFYYTGDPSTAADYFKQTIGLINEDSLQTGELKSLLINSLIKAAECKYRVDDNEKAHELLSDALSLCKEESTLNPNHFLNDIAQIYYIQGLIEDDLKNRDQALKHCEDSVVVLRLIPENNGSSAYFLFPAVLETMSGIESNRKNKDSAIEYLIESIHSQKRLVQISDGFPELKIKLAKKLKLLADLYIRGNNAQLATYVLFEGTEIIRGCGLDLVESRELHAEMLSLLRRMLNDIHDLNEAYLFLIVLEESFRKGYQEDNDLYGCIFTGVLNNLARIELIEGIYDRAGMYVRESAEVMRAIQNQECLNEHLGISDISSELSQIAQKSRNYDQSIQYLKIGIQSQEKILTLQPESWQFRYVTAYMHYLLGDLYDIRHDDANTLEHFTRALTLFQELPGLQDETLMLHIRILHRTGELLMKKQDFSAARMIYNKNLAVCREGNIRNPEHFRYELAFTLKKFAILEKVESHPDKALVYSKESIGFLHPIPVERESDSRHLLADNYIRIAKIEIEQSNFDEATDSLDQAEVILKHLMEQASTKSQYRYWIAEVLEDLGDIFRKREKIVFAMNYYSRCATLLKENGERDVVSQVLRADILIKISEIEIESGRIDSARNTLIQTLIVCRNGFRINPIAFRYSLLVILRNLTELELSANSPEQAEIYCCEAEIFLKDEPENSGDEKIGDIRAEIHVLREKIKQTRSDSSNSMKSP